MSESLTIGDVLDRLKPDFPDVTISKIRFLESQGLIEPERTPSGYRQFQVNDVDRLRWILTQQRENFLPLKVIKEKLHQLELGNGHFTENMPVVKKQPTRKKKRVGSPSLFSMGDEGDDFDTAASGGSWTRVELAKAADLTEPQIHSLESFGLIEASTQVGEEAWFDDDALVIARSAKTFFDLGIDARHLRMYKNAAEREVGLFQQVLLPIVRKKNPQARKEAQSTLQQLAKSGRAMRGAFIRQSGNALLSE